MKASLSSILLAACISIQIPAISQLLLLDSLQTERIAKTCQLWGHIKYFHPYLTNNSLDWESAFSDNIDDVIQAKTSHEFGQVIQKMLDQLHDPATHVVKQNVMNDDTDTIKYPVIKFIQDSILLIAVRDYRDLENEEYVGQRTSTLHELIPKSKGVLFDFRSSTDLGDLKGYLSYYFKEIEGDLVTKEFKLPGLRARYHDGFVPEGWHGSGGYNTGYYIKEEKSISPGKNAERPIVFIVNQQAEIPISALALQHAGKAYILTTDLLSDASFVDIFNFELSDSVSVNIRLNEFTSDHAVKADYVFPANTDEETILQTSLQLLKGQKLNASTIQMTGSGSAAAENEKEEQSSTLYPALGQRLLATAKIWTVIHYFFAYQDLMTDDWDEVLREFIPRFAAAKDSLEYHLAVAEMYTHIQDGHGFIRSKVLVDYFGMAIPPIVIRFIEDQPVVTSIFPDSIYEVRGIEVGDVILEVDAETVAERIKRMSQYISSSNHSALLNYISWRLLNGQDSTELNLKLKKKNGSVSKVTLPRYRYFNKYMGTFGNERSQTPITRLINKDVGYADLDRLTSDMVDQMFIDFKDTKAIIFDMRGYPHGTAWSISPHLIDKKDVYAANFRRYSPMSIQDGSSKHMTFFDQAIPPPKLPTYRGKTVMLIDERTQSQAEHTGLFFEAANGTRFIGSQTAGANGDVTNFRIPGNILLTFSGHDVRHIDGRQLQKVGLVPDVLVKPTIKGIRENKDEVLDKAIEYLKKS